MELNNIIFSISIFCFGFFISKYLLFILSRSKINLLNDNQFNKPQAFHEHSTYRLGGVIIYLLFILSFSYLFFYKNIIFVEYILFGTLFFFLGFADDLKIYLQPKLRLLLMCIILVTLVIFIEFKIERISFGYLNHLMKIDIFALFFVCICFLFIINGSNLIDGFNGLLSIHSLIILVILFLINLIYGNNELAQVLFYTILIITIFVKFNFPKAKMFLGDGGAYFIGTLISVSAIITNNLTPEISSFFFCILLFYIFFEVFFSFFRKIFLVGQNPLLPDNKHLHMLLYKFLLAKNKKKLESNYKVSIYINLAYLIMIIPGVLLIEEGLFCRYYFLLLLIAYTYFYKLLYDIVR